MLLIQKLWIWTSPGSGIIGEKRLLLDSEILERVFKWLDSRGVVPRVDWRRALIICEEFGAHRLLGLRKSRVIWLTVRRLIASLS